MWKKKLMAAVLGICLSLPLPVFASVQKDGVHITILHTNDMHARVPIRVMTSMELRWR